MKNRRKLWSSVFLAATLTACGGGSGGGGSDGGGSNNAGTAQGWWQGTTSSGYGAAFIVLENQETWGIYYSGNTVYGAFKGTSSGSGSSFTSSDSFFNFSSRTTSTATFSGSVTAGQSATLRESSTGTTFNGSYNTSYDTPANLANITGSFTGWGMTPTSTASLATVTISSSGSISANTPNCTVSGTVTPRKSGKGVFNVDTTFVGSGCAIGNGVSTSGIAILDTSSGTNRLIALTTTSNNSNGFIFSGESSGGAGNATSVPAQAAMTNWLKNQATYRFNSQLTASSYTCLGTYEYTKTSSTSQTESFGGYGNVPFSIVTTSNKWDWCYPPSSTEVSKQYYTADWSAPIGFSLVSATEPTMEHYGIYNTTPTIPTSLQVGDSGSLGTMQIWFEPQRIYRVGSKVVSYSASQESTSSILLTLTYNNYDRNNILTYSENDVFRITTDGIATLLSVKVTYANGNVLQLM